MKLELPEKHLSLSAKIEQLLKIEEGRRLSVGEMLHRLGDQGFGVSLVLLALPSALPIPAAGYSTPFGLALLFLGLQLMLGLRSPWLPKWAKKISLGNTLISLMRAGSRKFFARVEHWIHPRWTVFTSGPARVFIGILVVLMAALMALPIPGTNTAPAMVIFLLGVALSEDDGLMMALALVAALAATLLYAVVLSLIFYFGASGVSEALSRIQTWL